MLRRLALITLYALREHGGRTYSQRRIHRRAFRYIRRWGYSSSALAGFDSRRESRARKGYAHAGSLWFWGRVSRDASG